MIKLVIFDIAGTTILDKHAIHHAFIAALAEFGYNVSDKEARKVSGISKPLAIQMILAKKRASGISADYITQIYHAFLRIMKEYYHASPDIIVAPNVEEVFQLLHQKGMKVALSTGFSREVTNILIDRFAWIEKGYIEAIVTNDEVEIGQPEPLMIQKIMEMTGVKNAKHVAKVGDSLLDLQEGTNAGCGYVIGICSGAYTKEELAAEPHTHLISDLWELVGIFFPQSQESA